MNNIIFKTTFLKGEDGNNILRIDKTATSGLVDTYTITLTDGTTTNFQVTNGSSIATIEKTATVGMVDTYTITLTDGSTSTFEVTNGGGITVDDHIDANSTNPVQNGVIYSALNNIDSANVKYGQDSNVDAELDKLQQTPVTVGGVTMDTIDEKLNYLLQGFTINFTDKYLTMGIDNNINYDMFYDYATDNYYMCVFFPTDCKSMDIYTLQQNYVQIYALDINGVWHNLTYNSTSTSEGTAVNKSITDDFLVVMVSHDSYTKRPIIRFNKHS